MNIINIKYFTEGKESWRNIAQSIGIIEVIQNIDQIVWQKSLEWT